MDESAQSPSPRFALSIEAARHRARLLHRIEARYPTRTELLSISTLMVPFIRVADPDKVLDEVAAAEDQREKRSGVRCDDPQHLPYWAELWDSAAGLARFIVEHQPRPLGNVLDLGCGHGLSGLIAASLGASVMFVDLESPALLLAKLNSLAFADRVRFRRADWSRDNLGERFDLILGADILYEKQQWPFLESFWRRHLSPGGAIIAGEPGRPTGEAFIPWITQRRWRIEEFTTTTPKREKPIKIFRMFPPVPGGASIEPTEVS